MSYGLQQTIARKSGAVHSEPLHSLSNWIKQEQKYISFCVNPVMTCICSSPLHRTPKRLINTQSISYPSFHTYTYIKLCHEVLFFIFFYIRKIQDTDDWTLVAVLLMGEFYIHLINPETCFSLFYTDTSGEQGLQKYRINVQKPETWKNWNEKVNNRQGRAFIQEISKPFSSSSPAGEPTMRLSCLPKHKPWQLCAWLTDILTNGSGEGVKAKQPRKRKAVFSNLVFKRYKHSMNRTRRS